jgi:hypothetical protein
MSQLLAGCRKPGRALAIRIADETGIDPAQWEAQPVSKSAVKLSAVNIRRKTGRKTANVCRA